jgi:hypothetical protein
MDAGGMPASFIWRLVIYVALSQFAVRTNGGPWPTCAQARRMPSDGAQPTCWSPYSITLIGGP